eukprot:326618-Ditylum_brightwellii.AAC.2
MNRSSSSELMSHLSLHDRATSILPIKVMGNITRQSRIMHEVSLNGMNRMQQAVANAAIPT